MRERILIVEDDAIVASRFDRTVAQMGYEVVGIAATGAEAIALAKTALPDLILMDIRLRGGMNGIEASRLIREERDVPVIFLTAFADEAVIHESVKTGPYGYLTKPVREKELRAAMETAFYKSRTDRRLRHMNEVLAAAEKVRRLLVQDLDRPTLLQKACEALQSTRGYFLVWVMELAEDSRAVRVLAGAGEGSSAIQEALSAVSAGAGLGALPCCQPLFRRQTTLCADTLTCAGAGVCGEYGLFDGPVRSISSFPLHHGEVLHGALCVVSHIAGDFDAEEISLLEGLAADVGLSLQRLQEEQLRRAAETALADRSALLNGVLESNPDPIFVIDREKRLVVFNGAHAATMKRVYGGDCEVGQRFYEFVTDPKDVARAGEVMDRVLRGEILILDVVVGRGGIEERHLESVNYPVTDAAGTVTGVAVVSRDLTEKKRAEGALRESELQLRTLIDSMPDMVCFKDGQGRWLVANDFCVRLFRLEGVEYRGKTDRELAEFSPFFRDALLVSAESDELAWLARQPSQSEEVIPRPDGSMVVFDVIKVPTFQNDGSRKGIIVIGRDVTGRKRADEALRASEQRFRLLLENASEVAVQGYHPDGTVCYWSRACEQFYGYTADEAIGKNLVDLIIPPEMREEVRQAILGMAETGKAIPPSELPQMRKDGSRISVYSSHAVVKRPGAETELFAIDIDLTQRKEAEKTIRDLSTLATQDPNLVLRADRSGAILLANPASRTLLDKWGCAGGDFLPDAWRAIVVHALETDDTQTVEQENDGKILEIKFVPVPEPGCVNLYGADVTSRVEAARLSSALAELGSGLGSAESPLTVGRVLARVSRTLLGWDAFWLVVRDGQRAEPVLFMDTTGETPEECEPPPGSHDFDALVARTAPAGPRMESDRDDPQDPGRVRFEKLQRSTRTKLYAPISRYGKTIGLVSTQSYTEDAYSAGDLETLRVLAEHCAGALARLHSEADLFRTEETLTSVIERLDDVLFTVKIPDMVFEYVSPSVERLFGKPASDYIGRDIIAHGGILPEDRHLLRRVLDGVANEDAMSEEVRFLRPDGTVGWLGCRGRVIREPGGTPLRFEGIATDITARVLSEQRGRDLARFAMENPSPMIRVSAEGRVEIANEASQALMDQWECAVGSYLPGDWVLRVDTALHTSEPQTAEVDCGGRVFSITAVGVPEEGYANLYGADITARVLATRQLAERERQYSSILESTNDGIAVTTLEGNIVEANLAFCRMHGYSREELLGRGIDSLVHREGLGPFGELMEHMANDAFFSGEGRGVRADGSTLEAEVHARRFAFNGETHIMFVLRDITYRRMAESKLRLQGSALEATVTAIVITDHDGVILWANPAFSELTGYDFADCVGRKPSILKSGEQGVEFYANLWETIGRGEPWSGMLVNRRKDGSLYTEEMTITPVRGEGRGITHYIAVKQDATERCMAQMRRDAISRLGAQLAEATTEVEAARALAAITLGAFQWDAFSFVTWLAEKGMVRPVLKFDTLDMERREIPLRGECAPPTKNEWSILTEGSRLILRDSDEDSPAGLQRFGDESRASRSLLFAPLRRSDENLAIVSVQSYRPRAFSPEDLTALESLAAMCAAALERIRAETQLRVSEERYALAARGANDGLFDWDMVAHTVYFSPRWKEMLGHAEEEIGNDPEDWMGRVHPDDRPRLERDLAAHLMGTTPHLESEFRIRHRDESYRWMLVRAVAVRAPRETATRLVGSQTDITERKKAENQLLYDAFHDSLTGLHNRALFLDRLEGAVVRSRRREEAHYAVLFLDLDRFKTFNDSMGHAFGDELLRSIANRLTATLRPGDTLARLGGDEFAILLDDLSDTEGATRIARRILTAVEQPLQVQGHEVTLSGSIGIALSSSGYQTPGDVLRDADIALYRAKSAGRRRYEVFDSEMHARVVRTMETEAGLRHALDRDELVLHFQPIMNLPSGVLSGFEALVRWNRPGRGLVGPDQFIPVAEDSGLIVPMGDWVLAMACRQLADWRTRYPQARKLLMSVNVSARQFFSAGRVDPSFAANPKSGMQFVEKRIGRIVRASGLEPSAIALELTESVLIENPEAMSVSLRHLAAEGFRIHLDDFGTGYSSLSYLHQFPISQVKLDRKFTSEVTSHGKDYEITRSIVQLCHGMGMRITAEGVENAAQQEILLGFGCDDGQGFFFAPGLPAQEAEDFLLRYAKA